MTLSRMVHDVRAVAFGPDTRYEDGTLTVSEESARHVLDHPALAEVRLSWASPGDSVRLVKVLDAVEPRTKGPGGGGIFPGFVSPAHPAGRGSTHVLRGAAVVVAGFLPRAQEAVVQMSGEAADWSPFGRTHDLVVEFTPAEGASWADVDVALRRGALALAAHLAEAALEVPPDHVDELEGVTAGRDGDRPRVCALTNLQTQGSFKDVFVYGRSLSAGLPTLVDPLELEDGIVVSGQFGHPALRNPTYIHQNHPVVAALRARSDELSLAGVVLCPEPVDQDNKALISECAARLCAAAGFDAAVVTKEGGGNADADVALKLDALDEAGLAAVGLFAEMAGVEGTGASLVVAPTRPAAMVSTGNYDQCITLPAVERALGGDTLDVARRGATDEVEIPTAILLGALNPLGWGRLTAREEAA